MRMGLLLIGALSVAYIGMAQEEGGLWTAKVIILPEQDEVFPGEVIDVTLSGFLDEEGNVPAPGYRIVVGAVHGEVLNGESGPVAGGKSFPVSETVLVKYQAPLSGEADSDTLLVHSDHTLPEAVAQPPENGAEFPVLEKIGQCALALIRGNVARLTIYDFMHTQSQSSSSTQEIEITLGLRFQSLGGAGVLIPHEVNTVRVLDCSGTFESSDGERHELASAVPHTPEGAMMLYKNPASGDIDAVVFPQYGLKLTWTGAGDYTPPPHIEAGPVTEWDDKLNREQLESMAKDLQSSMRDGRVDAGKLMQMQSGIKQAITHPDYQVKTQFSKNYVAGEGKREQSGEDWRSIKRFTWEIQLQ
jgi:hypothetical protein